MKKLIFTISLLVIVSIAGFSQLKLEGSHNANLKTIMLKKGVVKYLMKIPNENQIVIYNLDHTVWKMISLSVPKNHKLDEIKHVSVNTLNKDQFVEIIYTCYAYEIKDDIEVAEFGYTKFIPTLNVINELGEVLLKIEHSSEFKIVEANGSKKLLVYQYKGDDFTAQNKTLIYNIGN
ncbi:MAG: hypothetical protein DRJ07_02695 [Bacteroidetes bacterium]|nr:MAG: hypothetical protein DRJ07_02695 [Bacteroidota bacterium]